MFKFFQFIKEDQDSVSIEIPKSLKGKLVEIVIQEKAPDPDTQLNVSDEEKMAQKEAELKMMDKVRNQMNVWDS